MIVPEMSSFGALVAMLAALVVPLITWGPAGTPYASINLEDLTPEQRAHFDSLYGGGSTTAMDTPSEQYSQAEGSSHPTDLGSGYNNVYALPAPAAPASTAPLATLAASGGGGGSSTPAPAPAPAPTPAAPVPAAPAPVTPGTPAPTATPGPATPGPTVTPPSGAPGGGASGVPAPVMPSLAPLTTMSSAPSSKSEGMGREPGPEMSTEFGARDLPASSRALQTLFAQRGRVY